MHNNPTKNPGFTLIELLVTMSIVGIVLSIAVPSFKDTIRNNRLTADANELITSLNLARSEAVKRGQSVVVRKTLLEWENGWQVFVDANNNNVFDDNGNTILCETGEDCILKDHEPLQTAFTLRGNNNFTSYISYGANGTSNTIGSFAICDNTDGNDIAEPNTSRLIIVNAVGRIRMAADNNHDGIPGDNPDGTGTEISSCTAGF